MQNHVSLNTKNKFGRCLQSLKEIAANMDKDANLLKKDLLQTLASMALPAGKYLPVYTDTLLFLCAYAGNAALRRLAENELSRIALHLKKNIVPLKNHCPKIRGCRLQKPSPVFLLIHWDGFLSKMILHCISILSIIPN